MLEDRVAHQVIWYDVRDFIQFVDEIKEAAGNHDLKMASRCLECILEDMVGLADSLERLQNDK